MKKCYVIVLLMISFLMVGCGKNQVVCTKKTTANEKTINEEVIAELDSDNKVTSVYGSYIFDDEEMAKTYCDTFKTVLGKEFSDKISCSNKKVTIKDLDKMQEDVEESKKVIGMSKEEFVKLEGETGHICE